jgi:hypothetical protein
MKQAVRHLGLPDSLQLTMLEFKFEHIAPSFTRNVIGVYLYAKHLNITLLDTVAMTKARKIYALLSVTGLTIALLGAIVLPSINIQNASAQVLTPKPSASKNIPPSTTTAPKVVSNTTSSPIKPNKPNMMVFQGHSLKIFTVTNFGANQWQPIDNLTSDGYDIKAIIPREDTKGHVASFTVVLEAKP